MKKHVLVLMVSLALACGCLAGVAEDGEFYGFGFGGGGVAAFWPDLEGVNAFLSENGLAPMDDVLFGGCGSGRGGIIGGPSLGGMGFGLAATSLGLDRSAELSMGGGGFDLGIAIGGDESSVLTLGAVLGGGASVLELTFPTVQPAGSIPQGIIPEPLTRMIGRAFVLAMPYVSFEAQLLSFVGFDIRIGYILPLFGLDFGDLLGISAPSVDLSGPFVSFSIVFGGIGTGSMGTEDEEAPATLSGTLELAGAARLSIENGAGEIVISSVATGELQSGAQRVIEWAAVCKGGREVDASSPMVEATSGVDGASLRTTSDGAVDYVLRVPTGTDLELVNGAGSIRVVGHAASSIRASVGVGEMAFADVDAGRLWLSVGVGEIAVKALGFDVLNAHVGIGRIRATLPPDLPVSISASAGIGQTLVDGFTAIDLRERGFLWTQSTDAVVGAGTATCELGVGIGEVEVRAAKPTQPKPE